jgi:hypothetical protein
MLSRTHEDLGMRESASARNETSPCRERRARGWWLWLGLALASLACHRAASQPAPLPDAKGASAAQIAGATPAPSQNGGGPSPRASATGDSHTNAPSRATAGADGADAKDRASDQGDGQSAAPESVAAAANRRGLCAIGVGVGAPLDYEHDITFADAIKVARAMEPAEGAKADENGWLSGDGAILVWAGNSNNRGTYKLKYDGQADVTIDLAQGNLSDAVYDAASNTSTRTLKLASDQDTLKLSFHKTTAGVRNVKLMRPVHPGADSAHDYGEMWYRPMKRIHARFEWLRVMDFTATNGQNVVAWRDRTLPARFSQQNMVEGTWWQGRGAAWEYAVHMANEERKDLWISVPLLADDDYVRKLAQLVRYGSDGKQPYAAPHKDPVWAPLAPNLKVYVEYSNEIWNFGFPQWTQLLEKTKAEVEKGGSNLNFDGSTSDGDWNTRHWARRLVQVSTMFRETFGDDAMMTRVRPVFATQLGWADNYLWHGLWFIDLWFNNGDGEQHVQKPHPVSHYVWGAGGSTYPVGFPEQIEKSKNLTVPQIFQGYRKMLAAWSDNQKRDIDYARAFGLERISYEGGPGLDNIGGDAFKRSNGAKFASQRDPRIKQVYLDMLRRYAELGGYGFTNFLTTNPTHGVLPGYEGAGLASAKAQALDQALSSAAPKPTWGVALPATISAGRFNVSSHQGTGTRDEPMQLDARTWLSYTVRSPQAGSYAIHVRAGSTEANAALNVWVDGRLAGTMAVPSTAEGAFADVAQAVVVTLGPGQHGIRLDGARGAFRVEKMKIERR